MVGVAPTDRRYELLLDLLADLIVADLVAEADARIESLQATYESLPEVVHGEIEA
jgi:hypothetical protein